MRIHSEISDDRCTIFGKGREKEVRAHDACVAKAREKTTECRVSAGRRTTSSR
ncbi:hypothetical protein PC128_g14692 [Phytophthora cactorum]|nr:hypothetical protein PC128_g14692 [Phytophthora cactorum]